MAQTGNLQADIAYKTRNTDGAPLDINGIPTSESGLRQAIALLVGTANPDPTLYEVEFYFMAGDVLTGNPTTEYDPAQCSTGFISALPNRLVFDNTNLSRTLTITSSGAWIIATTDASIAGVFTFSQTSGTAGGTDIVATTTALSAQGQGYITFKNTVTGQSAAVYFIHVIDSTVWILQTGTWNMLGFWFDNGIWNY